MMADLSRLLDRDVDIVIINHSSPLLFHEIKKRAVLVYDRTPEFRIEHDVYKQKMYQDYLYIHSIYVKGLKKRYGR